MALLLTESEVTMLLPMSLALEAVEEAFRWQGEGKLTNKPRVRLHVPGGLLHVMPAALPESRVMGLKAYATVRGGAKFVVLLFSAETGALLAIIEADKVGQMRTGAASGVATKYLARPDADRVGCYGTGWQARAQLEAVCAVRRVREVRVYGRDAERRARFVEEMAPLLGVPVVAVDRPDLRALLGGAATLVPRDDRHEFVRATRRLLDHPPAPPPAVGASPAEVAARWADQYRALASAAVLCHPVVSSPPGPRGPAT